MAHGDEPAAQFLSESYFLEAEASGYLRTYDQALYRRSENAGVTEVLDAIEIEKGLEGEGPEGEGPEGEGPKYDLTDNYANKSDDLQIEDALPRMTPPPAILWCMKWLGNPILFVITVGLAAIAIGVFGLLVYAFFTTSASSAQYGSWSTLGLGLLPVSASAFFVSVELLRQCWTISVRERKPKNRSVPHVRNRAT